MQRELTDALREKTYVMKREERSGETTSEPKGWYSFRLSKTYEAYGYSFNEARIVRIGEEIFE